MRIIRPVEITPAILTTSSAPETDYAAWDVATAYAVGERAMYSHRNYEALVAHTGANPETDTSDPPKWLDLGANNRWRMFDDRVGSLTEQAGSIAVSLTPGEAINALALFSLLGRSLSVTLTDSTEGVVYQCDLSLVDAGVGDWYEWFFAPIGRQSDAVLTDLPAYVGASLSVTVENNTETAACGHLVMGRQADIGVALYGTSVGITDYSRKETDQFGNALVVERAFSKRAEFDVAIETPRVSAVQRLLAAIRSRPVVWIGAQGYESTVLFGYYRDFQISISGPTVSDATITVEGLT